MRRAALILMLGLVAASAAAWPPWGDRTGWNTGNSWRGPAGAAGVSPAFDLNFADGSSVPSSALTINGVAMTPIVDCDARDISGTDWVCDTGGTLAQTTGTAPSTGQAAPLTEGGARAVGGENGAYYEGATDPEIDTDDFVVEALVRAPWSGAAERTIISLGYGAAAGPVLLVYRGSSLGLGFYSSVTGCGHTASGTIHATPGAWVHYIYFVKRGTNGRAYVDGAYAASSAGSCAAGDFDRTAGAFKIGAYGDSGTHSAVWTEGVSFARVYKAGCNDCIGTSTEWAATAKTRFAALVGAQADIAAGDPLPSTATRATVATVDIDRDDDGVRRVLVVGPNWPRVSRRPDSGATLRTGYLAEPQSTNLALQSQTFGTTWAQIDAGDSAADGTAAPDGTTSGDGIIADATDGQHGVTQAVTLTATSYTLSVWAQAGTQGHVYLSDDTVATADAYFDLSPCATGTVGAGAVATVEDYGSGWCRVAITYTGTVASHTHRIGCAAADGDSTFAGDGASAACILWGAQVEAQPVATSYIATTTASVTRNADDLRYDATSNATAATGTLEVAAMMPDFDQAADAAWGWIGNTAASTNYVAHIATSGDAPQSVGAEAGAEWSITGTGDVSDGDLHTIRTVWATDDARLFVDGAADGTPDTSVVAPASFTNIFVGENRSLLTQPSGVVTRLRIWPSVVTP